MAVFFMHAQAISISGLFKAMPVEEGGARFVYIEASNETRDWQGERVMCKALEASQDYYLRYGNLDLDHLTLLGPSQGIQDYHLFEIGQPRQVCIDNPRTFIKAELYRGDGVSARNAEAVWSSMTQQSPAQRWYPSVGGAVLAKNASVDPETGEPEGIVSAVRWSNIGLSKTPVNLAVPTVSSMPFGVFAKAWTAGGDALAKALVAGMSTDSAAMVGGQALGTQSLDKTIHSYWQFREKVSKALLDRRLKANLKSIYRYAIAHGTSEDDAAEWCERFLSSIKQTLTARKSI